MNSEFVEVRIPVPPAPLLENAIGYRGKARWMATWWEPAGDEVMVSDGQLSMTGEWEAWLIYVRRFEHALRRFNLGNSDQAAQHWLVIDREARRAYIAPVRVAREFLNEQWPAREPITLSEEQWNELKDQIANEMLKRMPSMEEIKQQYEKKMVMLAALRAWLNQN